MRILFLLIMSALPLAGQRYGRWYLVAANRSSRLEVDLQTQVQDDTNPEAWFRVTYARAKASLGVGQVKTIKLHVRADCATKQLDELATYNYDVDEGVLSYYVESEYLHKMESPVPETIGDKIVWWLCPAKMG